MIFAAGALASGLALCAVLFPPAVSRAERLFRLAAGAALGLGMSGALSMALRLSRLPPAAKDVALLVLGGAVIVAVRARGLRLERGAQRGPADRVLAAATVVATAIVLALFVEHTVRYPDGGWDARAIWNLRARALHRAPQRLDLVFSPKMPETHPDYPVLLPALVADALALGDGEESYASGSIALAFAALFVAVAATGAAALSGPTAGWVSALVVLGFPALLQLGTTQCADVPLAALFATACALVVTSRRRWQALALAGFAAALCALTKNEGLIWAGALAVAVSSVMGWRAARAMILGAAPGLLLLAIFKTRFVPPNDLAAGTSAGGLLARVADPHRMAAVVSGLVAQLWNFPMWGLTGPALALAAAWPSRRSRPSEAAAATRILRRTLALCVAALFGIYLAAPRDVGWLLPASADRLLLQLTGPAVLLASSVVGHLLLVSRAGERHN
jgi:hypothetical protein